LKKQLAVLTKRLWLVERQQERSSGPATGVQETARFRAMGVKAHRAKLGLSAKDYGRIVGVSGLTVYHWENGKAKPRNKQTLAKWLAVRGLGKREALHRLGLGDRKAADASKLRTDQPQRRGKLKQTGAQAILSFVKRGPALATRQINDAWRKQGRAGTADVTLGQLVRAGKLKRTKVEGRRGSQYTAA
jgi:DNA-binding transcriptional regulator YiaG